MAEFRDLILGVETSNPGPASARGPREPVRAGVALGKRRTRSIEVLAVEAIAPASTKDDGLIPAIDRLFRSVNASPDRLAELAVSVGPGGFTSLRIAVSAAKAISEATGARCRAVPTAAALIRRATQESDLTTVVALAWKREDAWRQVFAPGSFEPVGPGVVAPLDEIPLGPGTRLIADEELARMLRDRGVLRDNVLVEPPRFDPVAVIEACDACPLIDPLDLAPCYPREPEAVTKWRTRLTER